MGRPPTNPQVRFRRFVKKLRSGCWVWTGNRDRDGYGNFWFRGKNEKAHRVSFFFRHGYFPDEVEHLCDNPPCVRPSHLRDATHVENMSHARSHNAKKTKCPEGHLYDDDNTYIDLHGHRQCKECKRAAYRRWYHEQKAKK